MSFGKWINRVVHRVEGQVRRTRRQFRDFTHREAYQIQEAHKRFIGNVEHGAQRSFIYTVKVSPYITAVAALIVNIIPVVGQLVSLAIVAIGTIVNRYAGYYAARYQGATTQEARNYGRTLMRRNLVSGAIGSAIGGLLTAVGVGVSAGTAAAEGGGAAVEAGGGASLMAGEGAATLTAEEIGGWAGQAAGAAMGGGGSVATEGFVAGGIGAGSAGVEIGAGITPVIAAGASIFTKAWNWISSNPEKLLSAAGTVASQIMKSVSPSPSFAFPGMGGGRDPGGPGIGAGIGGMLDDAVEGVESFFQLYGEWIVLALAVALVMVLITG